jgi:hypothetical protein
LIKTPAGGDWTRFLYYADKVRELELRAGGQTHEEVFGPLGAIRPRFVLFPHLQRLSWYALDDKTLPYLGLFLAPSVHTFQFDPRPGPMPFLAGAVLAAANVLTSLRFLRVGGHMPLPLVWDPATSAEAFVNALGMLARASETLESLICKTYDVGPDTLLHLARLENLSELHAGTVLDPLATAPRGEVPLFPALTRLHIFVEAADLLPDALTAISSSQLEWLDIDHLESTFYAHTFAPVMRALVNHPSALTLRTLRLCLGKIGRIPEVPADRQHERALTLEHVRELFALRNLVDVTLDAPYLRVDDDMLLALPDHWPRLEALTLGGRMQPALRVLDAAPAVSLRTLAKLFTRCRRLLEANVLIDVELSLSAEGLAPVDWGLRTLDDTAVVLGFHYSTIQPWQVYPLAAALHALFPGVEVMLQTVNQCYLAFFDTAEQEELPPGLTFNDVDIEGRRRRLLWEDVQERVEALHDEHVAPKVQGAGAV